MSQAKEQQQQQQQGAAFAPSAFGSYAMPSMTTPFPSATIRPDLNPRGQAAPGNALLSAGGISAPWTQQMPGATPPTPPNGWRSAIRGAQRSDGRPRRPPIARPQ